MKFKCPHCKKELYCHLMKDETLGKLDDTEQFFKKLEDKENGKEK